MSIVSPTKEKFCSIIGEIVDKSCDIIVDTEEALEYDAVELTVLLKSIGFRLGSFEFDTCPTPDSNIIEIDIRCKRSGITSKLVLNSKKCTCPARNSKAENNNSYWEIQGRGPQTPVSRFKGIVKDTSCDLLPDISRKSANIARTTLAMLLQNYQNDFSPDKEKSNLIDVKTFSDYLSLKKRNSIHEQHPATYPKSKTRPTVAQAYNTVPPPSQAKAKREHGILRLEMTSTNEGQKTSGASREGRHVSAFQHLARRPAGGGSVFSTDLPIGSSIPAELQRTSFASPNIILKSQNFDMVNSKLFPTDIISAPSKMRQPEPDVVTVYMLAGDPKKVTRSAHESNLMAAFITANVYVKGFDDAERQKRYLGMYASIVLTFMDDSQLDVIKMTFSKKDFALNVIELTYDELKKMFIEDPLLSSWYQSFITPETCFEVDMAYGYIVIGLVLIFIGKYVNPTGADKYFEKRVVAFGARAVRNDIARNIVSKLNYPIVHNSQMANATVNCFASIRRMFFLQIVASSNVTDHRKADVLKMVLAYLAYTDMNHLVLIDRYLIRDMPEMLSMRALADVEEKMAMVYSLIRAHPPEYRPFLKFILSEAESDCMNRQHFTLATNVAKTIAAHYITSMANYTVQGTAQDAQFLEIIRTYLNLRQKTAPARHARFTNAEYEAALKEIAIEQDLGETSGKRD